MFTKKNKVHRRTSWITLLNADGTEALSCPAGELALPEPVVLQLSVEYFNDPEPCAIHRGAVHRRAMMELMEHCPMGETMAVDRLLPRLRTYFDEGVAAIRIEEIQK